MILSICVLTVMAAGYYIYITVKEKYRYFEKLGIPYNEPIFLLGNGWKTLLAKENMNVYLNRMYQENKDKKVLGLYHATVPILLINDAELVNDVLIKEFPHFHDRGIIINEEANPIEGHLFNIGGSRWKILRSKLSPTFTSGKIKGMLALMDKCADVFINDLESHVDQQINIKNEFLKLTAHIIGSCTFGIETDAIRNENSDFIRFGLTIISPKFKEFIKAMIRFFFPLLDKMFLKLRVIPLEVDNYFTELVQNTMDHRKKTGYTRNDFLQLLLELREKGEISVSYESELGENETVHLQNVATNEKLVLTDNILTAQAAVFLAAGFETTSTTLSFMCYELSKHYEIQDKLRKEIRSAKAKHGSFTYDALKEMHYLDAVVNETLRLWPPVGTLIRTCNKTIKLADDIIVEKDVIISIPVAAIQKDPAYFSDPELFKPERFLEDSISNRTFMPFGGGPRNCIGERFARLELKITAAKLLDKFSVKTCPKMKAIEPVQFKVDSFVVVPRDGIFCILNRLDK